MKGRYTLNPEDFPHVHLTPEDGLLINFHTEGVEDKHYQPQSIELTLPDNTVIELDELIDEYLKLKNPVSTEHNDYELT